MAIVVDYTPYQAVGELAQRAGRAENWRVQAQMAHQQQMAQLGASLQRQNMEFRRRVEQEAMAEQFQYNSALLQQKKQIDMDLELADYARNKRKLVEVMHMINESDEFSDAEKSQLALQAMSKYAGVGQGITASSFNAGGSNAMQNFLQQGTFKQQLAGHLQAAVDEGRMDPQEAENAARSFGLTADFPSAKEQELKEVGRAAKRLADAMKMLNSRFVMDGNKLKTVVNNKPADKVKEGSPLYNQYKILQKQVEDAQRELKALQEKSDVSFMRESFQTEVARSPELQKAVEIYGADKVFEEWKKRQGQKDKEKNEPIMKPTWKNLLPGGVLYQAYKGITG